MKKIVRLTESDLTRIVKRVIKENERVYGHEKIKKLYDKMGDDEHVELDDMDNELSGKIVKKVDYVKGLLKRAIQEKDWSKVSSAIYFMNIKM
jgi:hypothetical protein